MEGGYDVMAHENIDEKIVKMSLDNGQFESAIDKSINSIDRLEKKLYFKDAGDGFHTIQKQADKVDLSHIEKALDTITDKFTLLGMIGLKTLDRIADSAVRTGIKMAKSLTIQPALDGLNEYELKLNSIQTILANTRSKGTQLKDVSAALNELNTYADKTVYVFSDMTRAIGQFTTAGVTLENSTAAIKGMSNLAAAVGADNTALARANYQVSQALNSGVFKLMDWRSLENSQGMGGEILQEAIKKTAREFNVNVDSMISKHKTFRDSLQEGWLTADIYIETMKRFSDPENYPEYQYMEDAATKVRSFKKLMETTIEGIGSQWASVFEIIIGDFDEATALWTAVSNAINGVNSPITKMMNYLEDSVKLWDAFGGRKKLIEGFANVIVTIWTWLRPIVYALKDTVGDLYKRLNSITDGFKRVTSGLQLTGENAENVYKMFRAIFSIVGVALNAIKAVTMAVQPIFKAIISLLGSLFGVTGDINEVIIQIAPKINAIVNIIAALINMGLDKLIKRITSFVKKLDLDAIGKALGAILPIITALGKAVFKILEWLAPVINLIAKAIPHIIDIAKTLAMAIPLLLFNGISYIIDAAKNIGLMISEGLASGIFTGENGIFTIISNLCEGVINLFKKLFEIHSPSLIMISLGGFLILGLISGILGYTDLLGDVIFNVITSVISIIHKGADLVWEAIKLVISKSGEIAVNIMKAAADSIAYILSEAKLRFVEFKDYLTEEFGIDWAEVFRYAMLIGFIIALVKVILIIAKISKLISVVILSVSSLSKGINLIGKSLTGGTTMAKVQTFMMSFALLVASFSLILMMVKSSTVGDYVAAGVIIGVMLTTLILIMKYMAKISGNTVVIKKGEKLGRPLRGAFVSLILIILSLSVLVRMLQGLSSNKLEIIGDTIKHIVTVIGIIAAAYLIINGLNGLFKGPKSINKLTKNGGGNIFDGFTMLIASISAMILTMSTAFLILSKVDWNALKDGQTSLLMVSAFIGLLLLAATAIALVINKKGSKFFGMTGKGYKGDALNEVMTGISKLILSIAALFLIVAGSMYILSKINFTELEKHKLILLGVGIFVLGIILILAAMAASMTKSKMRAIYNNDKEGELSDSFMGLAKTIKAIGSLMIKLALAFVILRLVDWSKVEEGKGYLLATMVFILALVGILGIMAFAVSGASNQNNLMEGMAKTIKAISGLIIAIGVMFMMCWIINWDKVKEGSDYLLWAMGFIVALMGEFIIMAAIARGGSVNIDSVGTMMLGITTVILAIGILFMMISTIAVDSDKVNSMVPALHAVSWMLLALGGVLAVYMASLRLFGGGKAKSIMLSMIVMVAAIAGLFLAIGQMLKMSSNFNAKNIDQMTDLIAYTIGFITAILALVTIMAALKSTFAILGSIGIIASIALIFYAMGDMFESLSSLDSRHIAKIADKLKGIILIFSIIIGLITILSAIPIVRTGIFVAIGLLSVLFGAIATGFYFMGSAMEKIAVGMEKIEKLDPERLKRSLTAISESIDAISKSIGNATGGEWLGFSGLLWSICIPALILSVAFFNVALGVSLVVIAFGGLLLIGVLILALMDELDGVSLDNLGETLAKVITKITDALTAMFESDDLKAALSRFGDLVKDVVGKAVKGALEDLGLTWLMHLGEDALSPHYIRNKDTGEYEQMTEGEYALYKNALNSGMPVDADVITEEEFRKEVDEFGADINKLRTEFNGLSSIFSSNGLNDAEIERLVRLSAAIDYFHEHPEEDYLTGKEIDDLFNNLNLNGMSYRKYLQNWVATSFDENLSWLNDDGTWTSLKSDMTDNGEMLMKGLGISIDENGNYVLEAIDDLSDDMNEEFKAKEEIESPSKKWYRYGMYIMMGLANGIRDYRYLIFDNISEVSNKASDAMSTAVTGIKNIFNKSRSTTVGASFGSIGGMGRIGKMDIISNDVIKPGSESSDEKDEDDKDFIDKALEFFGTSKEETAEAFSNLGDKFMSGVSTANEYIQDLLYAAGRSDNYLAQLAYEGSIAIGYLKYNASQILAGSSYLNGQRMNPVAYKELVTYNDGSQAYATIYKPGATQAAYYASQGLQEIEDNTSFFEKFSRKFGGVFDVGNWIDSFTKTVTDALTDPMSMSTDLAASATGSSDNLFKSRFGSGSGSTTNNDSHDVTFNQYNYSPKEVDRSEIYQQTRRQLNSFKEFMQYY